METPCQGQSETLALTVNASVDTVICWWTSVVHLMVQAPAEIAEVWSFYNFFFFFHLKCPLNLVNISPSHIFFHLFVLSFTFLFLNWCLCLDFLVKYLKKNETR